MDDFIIISIVFWAPYLLVGLIRVLGLEDPVSLRSTQPLS